MKNKQKLSANNGVSFSYRVEANERIKFPFYNEIMLTLLAIITSVGAVMTLSSILNFRVSPGVVISSIAVLSIIYTILYKLIKNQRFVVIVGAIILVCFIALCFFRDFSKGFVIIFDQSRATICDFMGWDEPLQTYEWQDEFLNLTNFVTILLGVVLSSAISYFTIVHPSFLAIFLLTFPCFEIGAAFGAVPNYIYFSLMLASWAAALCISRISNAKIKMRRSNGEKQKKDIDGTRQKFAGIAVVIAIVIVILFSSISSYLNTIDFTRAENVDKLRTDTKYAFEDFTDYISGVDHDGSLKEGKLYAVDDREIKNRHYMTMQTNISEISEPIKIKGYTATVYKDNRWNQIENYKDYEAMFESFKESSYMLGVDTGQLLTYRPTFGDMYFADITMSDFRRKKPYAYQLYYSDLSENFTAINDVSAAPESKSKYSYTSYLSMQYIYKLTESVLYKDEKYKAAFSHYTDFVNAEYTKSQATARVTELAMSFEASDKIEFINAIRPYLQENIKHTNKVNKCPKDTDFVENFLFNTKKGYSTHFASAAAVLMQARGYPARYVEGYFIPVKAFNNTKSEDILSSKTIDITDKYAHAWIEIFDETYGWIPVEVTPGYWSGSMSMPKPSQTEEGAEQESDEGLLVKPPASLLIPSLDSQITEEFEIVEEEVSTKLEWSTPDTKTLLEALSSVLIALIVIVLILFVIYIVLCFSKRKVYNSDDVNEKLKFAYKYLVHLAAYQKIKIGNIYDYMALADFMGDKAYYISADKLKYIFNVFLKHAYSPAPASLEEANEVLKELKAYSEAIYADLGKYQKIIYKYLLHLK